MKEHEEIGMTVTKAFEASQCDALVAMGYMLGYERSVNPDTGEPWIRFTFDSEKCIVDAAASGCYGSASIGEFLAERVAEYLGMEE